MVLKNNILYQKLINIATNAYSIRNDKKLNQNFNTIVKEIVKRVKKGGKIYIAGNGGSSSDAAHLTAEFVCKINKERPGIAAENLMADNATITAIANDFGYEYTISRQLESKCTKKDIFIGITTSGNSQNIIEALKVCKGYSILLTGPNSACKASKLCDNMINVNGNTTDEVQELHLVIYHSLVYAVEGMLFK